MKRLKRRLTLKSNQSNDDWYKNIYKRRSKVSRDDAIDQTDKTTAISVTMLITIFKKQFLMGLEEDWLLLLPCTFVHCGMTASLHPCWIGTGGLKPTPQTKIFSHQCGGHLQPVGGLNPPTPPPTNRTLTVTHVYGGCRPVSLSNKRLCYCRGTARRATSVELL